MKRSSSTSQGSRTVSLERRIAAPVAVVFSYFTDPAKYQLWQGIGAELDPRPGGTYRVVQNDAGIVSRGEFIEIAPPHRIVFSWGWEGIDGLPPGASTVEVVLTADGDGTLLHLRHSGLPNESACQLHAYGWGVGLDNLTVVAAAPT